MKQGRLITFLVLSPVLAFTQAVVDPSYVPVVNEPTYVTNGGPVILFDEAHNNHHSIHSTYYPFMKLLYADGYRFEQLNTEITEYVLNKFDLLVIVNPLNVENAGNWTTPVFSAFTDDEIASVNDWVNAGGGLLIIADHMPFAGAAHDLAASFGFEFINGFAKTGKNFWPPSQFVNGITLKECIVTRGIDTLTTFTGSAFSIPAEAVGIMKFSDEHISLQPDTAWVFNHGTPVKKLSGYYQGALLEYGRGRIAVFGEAAMFTAQLSDGIKIGFGSEYARQNEQFALNIIHWLEKQ